MLDELRRHWPPDGQVLLLQAALADLETAKAAWHRWRGGPDLADASWGEVCLLAALGRRMPDLAGDAPPDPRVTGARRHIWTRTQMTYAATRPLLATLHAEGVRMMLMKGAARHAADPMLVHERVLRDADILVHPEDWARSITVAARAGWLAVKRSVTVASLGRLHSVGLQDPARQVRVRGEFDLHRYILRDCMNEGQDLGLWARAVPARFLDVDVLAPSDSDFALISLGQSMLFSPGQAPYWALDLDPLIRRGTIDWNSLLDEVRMRRFEAFIAAPLLLLRERIGTPVPDGVLRTLMERISTPALVEFTTRATRYHASTAEQVDAWRIMHAARAMRAARARPAQSTATRRLTPPSVRHAKLDAGEGLEIPVPRGGPPFVRRRLYLSFFIHRARHASLSVTIPGGSLKLIRLGRASRAAGGRVRRLVIVSAPACLFDLRDVTQVRVTANRAVLYNVYAGWSRPRLPNAVAIVAGAWRRWRNRRRKRRGSAD